MKQMKREENDALIRKHYREQADKDKDSPLSTIGERWFEKKNLISSLRSYVL